MITVITKYFIHIGKYKLADEKSTTLNCPFRSKSESVAINVLNHRKNWPLKFTCIPRPRLD